MGVSFFEDIPPFGWFQQKKQEDSRRSAGSPFEDTSMCHRNVILERPSQRVSWVTFLGFQDSRIGNPAQSRPG